MNKRYLMIILIIVLIFSGCSSGKDQFPDIDYPDPSGVMVPSDTSETVIPSSEDPSETAESTIGTDTPSDGRVIITAALPYKTETINALFGMYKEKYGIDADIKAMEIRTDGVEEMNLSFWKTQNSMPDIYLVNDIEAATNGGYAANLNKYLSSYDDIDPERLFTDAIYSMADENGNIYGLAHTFDVKVLIVRTDLLPEGNILLESDSIESSEFYDIVVDIADQVISDEEDPSDQIIPFIVPKVASSNDVYYPSENICDRLVSEGFAQYLNEDDQRAEGRAVIWVDDSSSYGKWEDLFEGNLKYFMISDDGKMFYADPVCVSSSSSYPDIAAGFSFFITFDPQAVSYIWENEMPAGRFPVITDSSVWNKVVDHSGTMSDLTRTVNRYMRSIMKENVT